MLRFSSRWLCTSFSTPLPAHPTPPRSSPSPAPPLLYPTSAAYPGTEGWFIKECGYSPPAKIPRNLSWALKSLVQGGRESSQKGDPNPIGRAGSESVYLGTRRDRKLSQRCRVSCTSAEDQAQEQSCGVPPGLHLSLQVGCVYLHAPSSAPGLPQLSSDHDFWEPGGGHQLSRVCSFRRNPPILLP